MDEIKEIAEVVVDSQSLVQSVKFDPRRLKCNRCGERKAVSEFDEDGRTLSGYKSRCRECIRKYGAISPYMKKDGKIIAKDNSVYGNKVTIPVPSSVPVPVAPVLVEDKVTLKVENSYSKILTIVGMVFEELDLTQRETLISVITAMNGVKDAR